MGRISTGLGTVWESALTLGFLYFVVVALRAASRARARRRSSLAERARVGDGVDVARAIFFITHSSPSARRAFERGDAFGELDFERGDALGERARDGFRARAVLASARDERVAALDVDVRRRRASR